MAKVLKAKRTLLTMRYVSDLSRTGAPHMTVVTFRVVRVSRAVHDLEKHSIAINCCVLLLHRQDISLSGSHIELANELLRHVCWTRVSLGLRAAHFGNTLTAQIGRVVSRSSWPRTGVTATEKMKRTHKNHAECILLSNSELGEQRACTQIKRNSVTDVK
jgi:hypothetical protein